MPSDLNNNRDIPKMISDESANTQGRVSACALKEAVVEITLPILRPIAPETNGTTIAVVYLARSADGSVCDFESFIESYRAHDAGISHDLIIVRKGLQSRLGSQDALTRMLDGIQYRTVDISDDGFDIQAYLKVAHSLKHDRICFLNTFSEIKADNWLRKLSSPLDRAEVGASGATASYESIITSQKLLCKVIWLTAVRGIQYSPKVAEQFHEVLIEHVPSWMAERRNIWKRFIRKVARLVLGRQIAQQFYEGLIDHVPSWMAKRSSFLKPIIREVFRPVLGQSIGADKIEAEFEKYWKSLIQPGGAFFLFRDIKAFPNPHLRSNAFVIGRELLCDLKFKLDNTKAATNRFESALDGLPARLAARGLSSILVGADGTHYEVAEWPNSGTFRLGDQQNVLVADNQVRAFSAMSKWQKALHTRMTWGDYLPGSESGIVDFGVKFKRGSINILRTPRSVATVGADLFFSIVIPTHNRLALLRDAIDSILRQSGAKYECVVFDNASDEPVAEYVSSLKEPRIRYERSDEFLPVTASWNRAIDLARGDYITLIGDDDGLTPNYFIKLTAIAEQFHHPDLIYSSLYQFFHPMVAPWERAGYVINLRNGFFFQDQAEPFLLNAHDAQKAVAGSLTLRRNFTFNMQAFSFHRDFLSALRTDGHIFRSAFPDYYLANVALGMGRTIAISPQPLTIAGVSRASFGFTLFNNLEEKGASLLNANPREDKLYEECASLLLPGPAYNTNYIITMEHVARKLGSGTPCAVDYQRYRRLQIYSVIIAQDHFYWMRTPPGSLLWAKLTAEERLWAIHVGFDNWRAKTGRIGKSNPLDVIKHQVEPYEFVPITSSRVTGRFARLPELLDALYAGSYP